MRNIGGAQGGASISIVVLDVFACPVSVVHGGVVPVMEYRICAQGVLDESGLWKRLRGLDI